MAPELTALAMAGKIAEQHGQPLPQLHQQRQKLAPILHGAVNSQRPLAQWDCNGGVAAATGRIQGVGAIQCDVVTSPVLVTVAQRWQTALMQYIRVFRHPYGCDA